MPSGLTVISANLSSLTKLATTIYPTLQLNQKSALHLTRMLEAKKAGRHSRTPKNDKPLTYEQNLRPDMIGVKKSWNTFNTSGLLDGIRRAETAHEDIIIRKMLHGIWINYIVSDVLIKRRANQIILNFMALRRVHPRKFYFLIGFTEELLGQILKCVVKVELQTLQDASDLTYKYV